MTAPDYARGQADTQGEIVAWAEGQKLVAVEPFHNCFRVGDTAVVERNSWGGLFIRCRSGVHGLPAPKVQSKLRAIEAGEYRNPTNNGGENAST